MEATERTTDRRIHARITIHGGRDQRSMSRNLAAAAVRVTFRAQRQNSKCRHEREGGGSVASVASRLGDVLGIFCTVI